LARWFLRENRKADFAEFSISITEKLNDETVERHLKEFAKSGVSASDYDKEIHLKLYLTAHGRFPQNIAFARGLLEFYKTNKREKDWRDLAARYYFASGEIREQFLNHLAEKGELRSYSGRANGDTLIYKLFRADAADRLSDFETAVGIYRELNQLYPNEAEFSGRLVNFTRSFGQKDKEFLIEAARVSQSQADFTPSSNALLTEAGEIQAELGDYEKAGENWEKLIATASGTREVYLETATVYWDYYQFEKARQTVGKLREKEKDETLYAFEMGAIYEGEKNERAAIDEYVKALDTMRRDEEQKSKAQKRLAGLARRPQLANVIDSSFQTEISRRKDASFLILSYAEVLNRTNRAEQSENLLNWQINHSRSFEFLESAREFYATEDNFRGEQTALRRLAEVADGSRQTIQYNLKLVESFRQNRDRDSAKSALNKLTKQFPTNYGVLTEAATIYKHLGFDEEAVNVLSSGVKLGKGNYREIFAQKLAKLLIELNRLDSAEKVLSNLHHENKINTEIFRALAMVYVRKKDKENLRRVFSETVSALKDTDLGRRELNETLAGLRRQMIDAFTRLEDYPAAVEQFIEIINHNSEAEEAAVENAISYVRRYGGADTLLAYYENLSKKSFKNYRWNVVLAKLYQAKNDVPKAVENYRSAIVNQPEMTELYIHVAELEASRANFDEAIKNLDTVLELTGNAPEFVKRKIKILEKWGKSIEAESLKATLPAENKLKEITLFEQAEKSKDMEKARELYRAAFAELSENPTGGEFLKAADINGFVNATREIKPLDRINEELWQLRKKLIRIREEAASTNAGEAGKRLSILDGAITESVGTLAKKAATDDELKNLHEFLSARIDETRFNFDSHQTVSLVQNISRKIGFGDLEEKILRKKLSEINLATDREIALRNLVNFYNERGAYQKTFELLAEYETNDLPLTADAARLVGNSEKELAHLRKIYWGKGEKPEAEQNENVTRYLEILYQTNRAELASLTEKSSGYQLQLINFLLGKGERQLSHQAIENAQLSNSWKLSQNAETSLALKEFGEDAECYFCEALQFERIGGLISQTPDKKSFLINDDWFRLTGQYGKWLYESKDETVSPSKFLAAMTENRPLDAGEQFKLGTYYLQKGEPQKVTERFRLALELSSEDESVLAHLGAAYYLAGETAEAENAWKRLLADKTISGYSVYLQALQNFGLAEKARADVFPILVEYLKKDSGDLEEFIRLIRLIAASFSSEKEKADYFLKICNRVPGDTVLAENLLSESLISENETNSFYEILLNNTDDSSGYDFDYEFVSVLQRTLSADEAEAIFDQENEYKAADEPASERYGWQRQYLELLVKRADAAKAKTLVAQIEKKLAGRYARPEWLRLIEMRLQMKEGNFQLINAERFVGISLNSSVVADIKPPSVERLNNVLRLLKEENLPAQALQIQSAFYARMLALGKFDAANFTGLSRALFQLNDTEKALKILQIFVDATGENGSESALAELDSVEIIKRRAADRTKLGEAAETDSTNRATALHVAAETATEFGQTNAAIAFRERLFALDSADTSNLLGLARLYAESDKRQEAVRILKSIDDDKNAARVLRWQARLDLQNMGEPVETKDFSFDAFSQFFSGIINVEKRQESAAISFFVDSLIADRDAKTSARIELVRLYALTDKPFAALRLGESIKDAKSDETLSLLSEAAEKTNDFLKAIEFEKSKNPANQGRIEKLRNLENEKNKKVTDFTINLENTRNL
jgi:predicted Zn-dependent protease